GVSPYFAGQARVGAPQNAPAQPSMQSSGQMAAPQRQMSAQFAQPQGRAGMGGGMQGGRPPAMPMAGGMGASPAGGQRPMRPQPQQAPRPQQPQQPRVAQAPGTGGGLDALKPMPTQFGGPKISTGGVYSDQQMGSMVGRQQGMNAAQQGNRDRQAERQMASSGFGG